MSRRAVVVRSQLERLDTLCAAEVTRDGELDPCCKPATAVLFEREFGDVWPACAWHANRWGGALTLAQVREALTKGSTTVEVPDES